MANKHPGKILFKKNQNKLDALAKETIFSLLEENFPKESPQKQKPAIMQSGTDVFISLKCSKRGSYSIDLSVWLFYGFAYVKFTESERELLPPVSDEGQYDGTLQEITKNLCNSIIRNLKRNVPSAKELVEVIDKLPPKAKKLPDGKEVEFFRHRNIKFLTDYLHEYWTEKKHYWETAVETGIAKRIEDGIAHAYIPDKDCAKMELKESKIAVSVEQGMKLSIDILVGVTFGEEAIDGETRVFKTQQAVCTRPILFEFAAGAPQIYDTFDELIQQGINELLEKIFSTTAFLLEKPIQEKSKPVIALLSRIDAHNNLVVGHAIGEPFFYSINNSQRYWGKGVTYYRPYLWDENADFTAIVPGEKSSVIYGNPLSPTARFTYSEVDLKNEQDAAYSENRKLPTNMFEFSHFLSFAEERYKRKCTDSFGSAEAFPRLIFEFKDAKISRYVIEKHGEKPMYHVLQKDDACKSAGDFIEGIIDGVLEGERDQFLLDKKIAEQLTNIGINFVDYEILHSLLAHRGHGHHRFWTGVMIEPAVYDAEKERSVNKLCQMTVGITDDVCSVIEREEVSQQPYYYRYNYTEYMYKCGRWINERVLSLVHVKPIGPEDLSGMNPEAREEFFENAVSAAVDRDQLWDALQLLQSMPQAFAAKFVKSENGKAFLLKMTGDDALYAKYFVQSLSGCKKLADAIFK